MLNLKLFNKTIFTYCGADTLYMNDVPLLREQLLTLKGDIARQRQSLVE